MRIVEKAEICFCKVSEVKLVLRNIPPEMICKSAFNSSVIKSYIKEGVI